MPRLLSLMRRSERGSTGRSARGSARGSAGRSERSYALGSVQQVQGPAWQLTELLGLGYGTQQRGGQESPRCSKWRESHQGWGVHCGRKAETL